MTEPESRAVIPYIGPMPLEMESLMARDFSVSIGGWLLLAQAKTLQQRVFSRLISSMRRNSVMLTHVKDKKFTFYPFAGTVPGYINAAKASGKLFAALTVIPFATKALHVKWANDELTPPLQDLADIIAWEASEAFRASYYPGVDINALESEHVDAVMAGMQREATREKRGVQEVIYAELPRKRQVALAERRRWWFGHFGITPKSWRSGVFSLWDVSSDLDVPEEVREQELDPSVDVATD